MGSTRETQNNTPSNQGGDGLPESQGNGMGPQAVTSVESRTRPGGEIKGITEEKKGAKTLLPQE